ncbi:MAG: tRNA uridine(34) 5-carboxymethylaminomethyl modification radical SAM/GNAT enzyme Elp3 [Acidobacteriota bacterium]
MTPPKRSRHFDPSQHEGPLRAVVAELMKMELEDLPAPEHARALDRLVRRNPREDGLVLSKSELIQGCRWLAELSENGVDATPLIPRLRKKPMRSLSGVATVTVLTRPHPCPGRCIFCPSDVRMPKSYLADEPGAQRAAQHAFDPYLQTYFRLKVLHTNGHPVDKIELLVLGGTWSSYPESYQIWFLTRCFEALNDFGQRQDPQGFRQESDPRYEDWVRDLEAPQDGPLGVVDSPSANSQLPTYNLSVRQQLKRSGKGLRNAQEKASWDQLEEAQRQNEGSKARCVGLVLETRPDCVDEEEVRRLRRLGATRVQIGLQSLDDEVLEANRRGHDVAAGRRAMAQLRRAGFKIVAHWMPNLYGATAESDAADFRRLFSDPSIRPDELKIYPCSLIEGTELMERHREGSWLPYEEPELLDLLVSCLEATPPWCRLTRVIRDIPSTDIVVGNKKTNFRQIAEAELAQRGQRCRDVRAREVRGRAVQREELRLEVLEYDAGSGRELFFQFVTADDQLAGFLRLALPGGSEEALEPEIAELAGAAIIREVHVYGALVRVGERKDGAAQHAGLGRTLVENAARRASEAGFRSLAVISSVGTRRYYRRLGFVDGELYQHRELSPPVSEN